MGRKYTAEMHEKYREEQDEKAAAEETARRERTEKEAARRAWVADGGNAGDFEKAWPALRDEDRGQRVLGADREAREAQRRQTHKAI